MTIAKIGVRDLVRNSNQLKDYDYVEIEDKKTHKIRGIFISGKVAAEFKKYLKEKKEKQIQEKMDALDSIVKFAKSSHNPFLKEFDKSDVNILQKVKGISK